MPKNDIWIKENGKQGMIKPFQPNQIKSINGHGVISFGVSSYGYDLRLSPKDFKIFRHIPGTVLDPKRFNPKNLEQCQLKKDGLDRFFILPAHSYGLGIALEWLQIPNNVVVLCVGKSTYARCGLIANVTPAEPGWEGHLTLEFSNSSDTDCRIYANEGIVQLLFFEGQSCETSYAKRMGKYQGQGEVVTLPRV